MHAETTGSGTQADTAAGGNISGRHIRAQHDTRHSARQLLRATCGCKQVSTLYALPSPLSDAESSRSATPLTMARNAISRHGCIFTTPRGCADAAPFVCKSKAISRLASRSGLST
jgi:hypothetical protein